MKPFIGTANLLAGQAVALAQSLIDDRRAADAVNEKTIFLLADLKRLKQSQLDLPTSSIIDATNLLVIAVRNASSVSLSDPYAPARAARWRELLEPMIEHVRRESLALNEEGHFA